MTKRNFLPSAPNKTLWIIAVLIGGLGIVTHYMHIDQLSQYSYIMLLIGFVMLVVGTAFRNT